MTFRTCWANSRPKTQAWIWTSTVCSMASSSKATQGHSRATPTTLMDRTSSSSSTGSLKMDRISIRISTSSNTIRMTSMITRRTNKLMKMEFHFLLQMKLKTSSIPSQASSMRRKNKIPQIRSKQWKIKTHALYAWRTCSPARWSRHWLVPTSSTLSALTSGWNKNSNAPCAKRE